MQEVSLFSTTLLLVYLYLLCLCQSVDSLMSLNQLKNRLNLLAMTSATLLSNLTTLINLQTQQNLNETLVRAAAVSGFLMTSHHTITTKYSLAINEQDHATALLNMSSAIGDSLSAAKDDLQTLYAFLSQLSHQLVEAQVTSSHLANTSAGINSTIASSRQQLMQTKMTAFTVWEQLAISRGNITALTNQLTSGSTSGEQVVTSTEALLDRIHALQMSVEGTRMALNQSYGQLTAAVAHSNSLQSEATYICW